MLRFGNMLKASRSQSGFTIVEVSLAILLLVMASVGMIGVFNSSTQLSLIARQAKEAQQFARTVSEKIRVLPFYVPYDGVHNRDVDDFFWGTAEQHGGSITNNNWDTPPVNPFVDCTLVTDSRFTCQVKMAYLLDDLSTIGMKSGWIPKAGTGQEGKDEPRDIKDKAFNIIKYEVKVTWISRRVGGSATRTYSYVTLMTSTESEANIGVVSMINTSTESSKWGTGGKDSNTAPHTASDVQVKIAGYGFNDDSVPLLVRSGYPDVTFLSFTVVNSTTITGSLSLNSGSTGKPWSPRQAPGMWTVRVTSGVVFAYGYEIFKVEFPRPVITYRDPVRGPISKTDFSITAGGNNVLNLGGTPPTPYCGATIRLVKDDDPAAIIDPIAGKPITYKTPVPADKGYTSYNTVTAVFNLRGRQPGNYYVEIANCESNAGPPEGPGNTISLPDNGFKFEIYSVSAILYDVYVIGSSGNEVYVAADEKRHFAYRLRSYAYNIQIEGTNLEAVETVKIGINGDPNNGTSPDKVIDATILTESNTVITARVDFNDVSSSLARDDTTYSWWVYCAYAAGQSGSLEHCLQIRNPRPILYKNAEYVSGPAGYYTTNGGLYHNYHSVTARLTGECFDAADNVKYLSGDYGTGYINNVEYTVGTLDGTMTKGSPTNNGTRWEPQLNLIHCRNTANNIWIAKTDGTTDNNKTSTTLDPGSYKFNVVVVPAPTPVLKGGQDTGAVSITSWYNYGGLQGPRTETENASTKARAQRTNWPFLQAERQGYAQFTLRGQGFKDEVVGTSNIKVFALELLLWWQKGNGDFSVANPADLNTANEHRNAKYVTIRTNAYPSAWQMPNGDEDGRILITNTGSSDYTYRFLIRNIF